MTDNNDNDDNDDNDDRRRGPFIMQPMDRWSMAAKNGTGLTLNIAYFSDVCAWRYLARYHPVNLALPMPFEIIHTDKKNSSSRSRAHRTLR